MKLIRKSKILLTIVIAIMLSISVMGPQIAISQNNNTCIPGSPSGKPVQPTCHEGNPDCCDLSYCDNELKIEPPFPGDHNDGVLYVTITVTGEFFNWSSNIPVDAVIVKGGPNANLFEYDPALTSDTDLHAPINPTNQEPYGLSHITFCYSEPELECPTCSIDPVESVCEDGVVFSLNATIDPGDYTSYDLLWDDGGVGGTFSPSNSAEDPTWTPPAGFTGTATLTLTVTANDCVKTCDVEVTVYPKPACNITCDPKDCTTCENGGVTLTETGGDAVKWLWSTGETTKSITVTASGTYSVTVTDKNGCQSTCEKTVTIYEDPACNITCYPENCRACEDGEVTLTENGGDAVKWLWSTGETTKSITVTASGTYSVTIKDEFGCQSTCEKKVTIYEDPACNIVCDPKDCIGCEDGGVTLTENGGDAVKWLWSTGETTQSITVTASGTYSVTITDEFGCQSTCEKKVTVYPKPTCIIASVGPICAGESVQLNAAVNGGTPSYTYSWDDGGVGGTFSPSNSVEDPTWTPPAGFTGTATLTLTVTDSKGCTTTCFVNVTVDPCEECKCSLVVLKRDEAGHPIDGAVFEVNGIQKTITGGEARWFNLECNTTYEVKEISPEKITRRVTLGDCGERSTMTVVNEAEIEVAGFIEVLPFTGPVIPYSPFIGISTVLAGAFLYILSKPKKKR